MRHLLLPLLILTLAGTPALAELSDCPSGGVRLLAPNGEERARYRVRVARTPQERERGLMFVEEMPADEGMLFLFDEPSEVGFWMRDTLIPLDLIFIEATGRIVRIHPDAIPHDETPIWSGSAVTGVLELNGGAAGRAGAVPGDMVSSPFFAALCGSSADR
jgi:uncharacterized membrane protein (UPF0127 family)